MRVLVAGATSVPGIPVMRELVERGHEVLGVTRSAGKTGLISAQGVQPAVADVLDAAQIDSVVAGFAPETVESGQHTGTEGIVLRYGVFYGPGVTHDELFH